jgi:hypothetical protein
VAVALVVVSCGFPRPPDVGYQLLSIEPAIATTDDTITLEGTFGASATVQFPGGATQAATILSEHRATVVVPAAATAGDLTVTTDGVTIGPLPFRRTSFALGLQQFRASYEQADGGRQGVPLATARSASTAVVVGGSLYVLGGADSSGPLSSIERAPINADGTIGSFSVAAEATLATARSGHMSLVVGNSLYLLGGTGSTGALSSVERATINADGSLDSFTLLPEVSLAVARTGATSAIVGNSIYVIGGTQNDGRKLSSIERATIQLDGSLGPFELLPDVALVTPRSDHTSEVIGNTLYVLGGDADNGVRLGDIERAAIQPDGTLSPFSVVSGLTLREARSGHRSVVVGSGLYVLGGAGTSGVSATVERAPIAADGSLAPFTTVPSVTLSTPRTGMAIATVGIFLYVFGGSLRTVERASLDTDSVLGAFAASNVSLVESRISHTSAIVRNFVYVIGGSGTPTSIERAGIRPDGSLGFFAVAPGLSLVSPRPEHTTVTIRNFLYVLGGGSGGGGFPSSIERAVVNDDGSLSPFTTVMGVALNQGRSGHISVVLGDFLYVIGGYGSSGRLSSVERASINANGTLGAFATVPGVTLNIARNLFTALTTNRYLYIIGGASDAGELTSVERASIGGDGSLGPFTTISNGELIVPRISPASAVVGSALYVIGGRNNTTMVTTMERTTINADGSLSAFAPVQDVAPTIPRSAHTATVIGDSLYLIGGNVDILNSVEHASLR